MCKNLSYSGSALVSLFSLALAGCISEKTVVPFDFAITNVHIVGVSGPDIPLGYLAVRDGKIAAISEGKLVGSANTIVDGSNMSVMPGMIDTHVHLITGPKPQEYECRQVLDHLQPDLEGLLRRGITTVMSVGDVAPDIAILKERIASGMTLGPTLFITGPVFAAPNHPSGTRSNFCNGLFTPLDAPSARNEVKALAALGVDGIKILYDENWPPRIGDEIVTAIVDEAHKSNLPVLAHVQTYRDAEQALKLGIDRLVHFPHVGAPSQEFRTIVLDRATPITTTSHLYAPISGPDDRKLNHGGREIGERLAAIELDEATMLANMREFADAGIRLAFGTDRYQGENTLQSAMDHEIETLSREFTPAEILKFLTENAAVYIGKEKSIGSLAVGKNADLVMVDGDPTQDLSALQRIQLVIKNGQTVVDQRLKKNP